MIARKGAYALHRRQDPHETTRKARETLLERLTREVDPHGTLDEASRATAVKAARSDYYRQLAQLRWKHTETRSKAHSTATDCAWCAAEQQRPVTEGVAVTVCRRHYKAWMREAHAELAAHPGALRAALSA